MVKSRLSLFSKSRIFRHWRCQFFLLLKNKVLEYNKINICYRKTASKCGIFIFYTCKFPFVSIKSYCFISIVFILGGFLNWYFWSWKFLSFLQERSPPPLDDFQFICDDAYTHKQFVDMELKILKALDFDINIPVSYRFLRRYARVSSDFLRFCGTNLPSRGKVKENQFSEVTRFFPASIFLLFIHLKWNLMLNFSNYWR